MSPWGFGALAAAVLAAYVLVRVFRWDERCDRTVDPEYHWKYPGIDRAQSVVKLAVRLGFMAAVLATASLYLWNAAAGPLGKATVPVPFQTMAAGELGRFALFWKVTLGWVAMLALRLLVRCSTTPLHDIFISYKSEDVAFARRIADALTAAGWRVWFAEYQVLLQRRDRFQLAILQGIFGGRFGLAITNDRWAGSEHCQLEMTTLLKALGPEQILELRRPKQNLPHLRHPALGGCRAIETDDVEAVLEFVQQATGVPVPRSGPISPPSGGHRYQARCGGRPCSLLMEGWTLQNPGEAADGSLNGQTFLFGSGAGRIFVNVHSGPEESREGQRTGQAIDDRQMFDALVAWAPTHVDRVEARVRGVHLLFHSGLSQMALTYWVRPRTVDGPGGRTRVGDYWSRKVSIIIPNPVTGETAEFVFTFGFTGTFADYCRHAHLMDAFALSLEWS